MVVQRSFELNKVKVSSSLKQEKIKMISFFFNKNLFVDELDQYYVEK
jgi:hypothetical protein